MLPLPKPLRFVRGLRFRLAFSYVLFFAILLVALGIVAREALQHTMEAQAEDFVNEEWGAVKGYLRIPADPKRWFYDEKDPDEAFTVERLRRVYMLADVAGHPLEWSVIYKSIGFDTPEDIRAIVKSGEPAYNIRYSATKEPFLIRSGVIYDDPHKHRYYLAIGRSIADNRRILNDFTFKYFSILPGIIALSALLGWFLARRALDPVNSVAETAQRITHSNLDMKIAQRGAGDELDRLIEGFNRMVERLRFSFEQIRRFSTDVSHELRTPLTVIRGQLEVALFTAKTNEQYRDAMITSLEGVERLSNIVRALLMLSQAESGQIVLNKAEVDLAELTRNLVEEYQIPAETQGVILTAGIPNTARLLGDRVQMERLVANLLSNAIKYTPAGGKVRLTLSSDPAATVLTVEDTGVGIAPDHIPHIFDRFYRVPSADPEKGLGLGLSFVAWIVKAHEGTIDVHSELQKGTKFTVRLPPAPATAPVLETPVLAVSE